MEKLISSKRGPVSAKECSSADFYETHGFAFVENAVRSEHLDAYEKIWLDQNSNKGNFAGWGDDKCYMTIDEVKDVLCSEKLNEFFFSVDIGVALHVAKTDWAPSFITWHIDAAHTHEIGPKNYVGSYVALEDTDIESGPIQIISGSHKWNLDYESVFSNPTGMFSHQELEQKRIDEDAEVFTVLPGRGDAFVWHGRSVHRGTEAIDCSKPRKGVVAHYCNRLVAEDFVNNAGGHVSAKNMVKQFISNTSGDDDHFFKQWRTGGYYYPDCTITRSWLRHAHPEIENPHNITWDELTQKIDVSARGDMYYLGAGYDPEYSQ